MPKETVGYREATAPDQEDSRFATVENSPIREVDPVECGYELDGEIAVVTLRRPSRYNAVTLSMARELTEAIRRAGVEARAAVITGEGRAFCAGADLIELTSQVGEAGDLQAILHSHFHPLIEALWESEVPTLAAINGPTAGAGMGIALCCDLRVMDPGSYFMSAFIHLGLTPDSGAAWMLGRMVGLGRAMEIVMSGRKVPAGEALEIGLANKVSASGQALSEAMAWANQLCDGPTSAYAAGRRLLYETTALGFAEGLAAEAVSQGRLGESALFGEGVAAFKEKRKPDFRSL
ncbi:MAG: 2-(1,2-epoxy-1,2-dihydrophenyl)acetyl-CoA isomerase [Acidimicrobiia bacterium]|nr:2-(1,2-epoxy-1,2-dihydrophenyl)acetyl-CoA isomerase [Acidimicrobiia bacterium]MYD41322.1 2-(1,2-epoxy-1,2-dihydrophenyl)acetyl-CoA isomerase [Acidimicrobiia bacterium]MYK55136.1 2-(1,2-epoxy-1,2-dihydrophenyl)acetyl-CoA isomerase [Acidimicrobiia bacterium]